jgi:hypothetical protein
MVPRRRVRPGRGKCDVDRTPNRRGLDALLGGDLAGGDGLGQPLVIALGLVGVGGREAGDRLVELRSWAEIGGDREPVAGASVGAGERPPRRGCRRAARTW